MTGGVEQFGGLGVGVGGEEPVQVSQGGGIGLAGLPAGEGEGKGEAGGLAAVEADVQVDVVGAEDGDVFD